MAAQVLSRLQKVFENGMLARKIQKLMDDGLQVVHLGEEVCYEPSKAILPEAVCY